MVVPLDWMEKMAWRMEQCNLAAVRLAMRVDTPEAVHQAMKAGNVCTLAEVHRD